MYNTVYFLWENLPNIYVYLLVNCFSLRPCQGSEVFSERHGHLYTFVHFILTKAMALNWGLHIKENFKSLLWTCWEAIKEKIDIWWTVPLNEWRCLISSWSVARVTTVASLYGEETSLSLASDISWISSVHFYVLNLHTQYTSWTQYNEHPAGKKGTTSRIDSSCGSWMRPSRNTEKLSIYSYNDREKEGAWEK